MITNKLFCIAIPTVNQASLLNPNLINFTSKLFPGTWILVVDNGNQDIYKHENITILKQKQNIFVSASWNLICDNAFMNYPYVWILNDDCDYNQTEDHISELIKGHINADFYNSFHQWASFILPKETFFEVGRFDEQMPIWHSDCDYEQRMKRLNLEIFRTRILNPTVFRQSMSAEKDNMLHKQFELSRQVYIKKYGGNPGFELY